jgi:membrane protein DedA with SNARE-associated domain/rhodanese-related sulfurtransferase
MSHLIILIQTYGLLIVFGTVLLEQIGLPIPAFPILIVAGALAIDGDVSWQLCLAVSMLACLISDFFWFRAGRFYGKRILKLLCKISLSADQCVNQTEDNFNRYGAKSLVVAKFIPGFNTIAPPLAGALGVSTTRFLAYSVAGALLWSGVGVGIGAYFHNSVDQVLEVFDTMGSTALMVVLAALAAFILYKFIERRRFRANSAIERIGMEQLLRLMEEGAEPLIIDARSSTAQQLEAAIPGAVLYNACDREVLLAAVDKNRHIVVYCSCPNDVTAAQLAKELVTNGFHRARPLHGGLDAWNSHHGAAPLATGEVRLADATQ